MMKVRVLNFFFLAILLVVGCASLLPPQVLAYTQEEEARGYCEARSSSVLDSCLKGFNMGWNYKSSGLTTDDPYKTGEKEKCPGEIVDDFNHSQLGACAFAFLEGYEKANAPSDTGPVTPTAATDPTSKATKFCTLKFLTGDGLEDCYKGYTKAEAVSKLHIPDKGIVSEDAYCSSKVIKFESNCRSGWQGFLDSQTSLAAAVSNVCASESKQYNACKKGVTGYIDGKSKTATCKGLKGDAKATCETAYDTQKKNDESTASKPEVDNCDTNGNPLSWIVCPVIDMFGKMIDGLDGMIYDQLTIGSEKSADNPSQIFCDGSSQAVGVKRSDGTTVSVKPCESYQNAWKAMRNLSLGLMVIAGIVALIAQNFGLEIFDAYTVRKILPRILFVAIAISLSWELMRFFVTLTNDIGLGVRTLVEAPFKGLAGDGIDGTGKLMGVGAGLIAVGFIAATGLGAALTFILTAALGVLVGVAVVLLRQLLVTLLILLAPIAIVMYVLPNTQRMWKMWWDYFWKALFVFPIIELMIASGHIAARIAYTGNSSFGKMIGMIAYFAPYFMLPMAFKFSGGAMAGLSSFVGKRASPGFQALKGYRQQQRKARVAAKIADAKHGNFVKNPGAEGSLRRRLNKRVQDATLLGSAGINPTQWKHRMNTERDNREIDHMEEMAQKSRAVKMFSVNDGLMNAYNSGKTENDWRNYMRDTLGMNDQDVDRSVALIRAAERDMGANGLNLHAAIANAGTGTGYGIDDGGSGEMARRIAEASHGSSMLEGYAVANARKAAAGAKRADLDASFGAVKGAVETIRHTDGDAAKQAAAAQATIDMTDSALFTKTASEIMGGRGESVSAAIPAIQRRITNAFDRKAQVEQNLHQAEYELQLAMAPGSGASAADIEMHQTHVNQAREDAHVAHSEAMEVMAFTDNLLDVAGYSSPEAAKILKDGVMSNMVNVGKVQVGSKPVIDPTTNQVVLKPDGQPQMEPVFRDEGPITVQQALDITRTQDGFREAKRVHSYDNTDPTTGLPRGVQPPTGP